VWRVRTAQRIFASPALDANAHVVFASIDGRVLSTDTRGVVRWAYTAPSRVFSAPAIYDALCIVGHDGRRFVALDERGSERWSVRVTDDADAPPLVAPDGTVYVASRELVALDRDGRVRWSTPLHAHVFGAPALAPTGTLVVTDLQGGVTLLRADTGAILRRIELGAPMHGGALILEDGGFVVGADDGHVRAFTAQGDPRWDTATQGARVGAGVRAMPALTRDDVVVVGAEDGGIYGLRATDGSEAFRVATYFPVRSSATIDVEGWIYVGGQDDAVHALDRNGRLMWSVTLGADIDGAPLLMGAGALAVGADDGGLYLLRE
jgi:outer membrane protein assembly factor BamB